MPLCKLVAQAGWEPITGARRATSACTSSGSATGETRYLTVFNDSPDRRTTTITLDAKTSAPATSRELVSSRVIPWTGGKLTLPLDGEDVAVLELGD